MLTSHIIQFWSLFHFSHLFCLFNLSSLIPHSSLSFICLRSEYLLCFSLGLDGHLHVPSIVLSDVVNYR